MINIINSEKFIKIFIVVLTLFVAVSAYENAHANNWLIPANNRTYQLITVNRGDTVWLIASRVAGKDQDIRNVVASIIELNGLSADVTIQPGQVLKIPKIN